MENTFVQFLSLGELAAAKNLKSASLLERSTESITDDKPSKVYISCSTKAGEQFFIPCQRAVTAGHKLAELRFGVDTKGDICALVSKAVDTETF